MAPYLAARMSDLSLELRLEGWGTETAGYRGANVYGPGAAVDEGRRKGFTRPVGVASVAVLGHERVGIGRADLAKAGGRMVERHRAVSAGALDQGAAAAICRALRA